MSQNERRFINEISPDGKTLTFEYPLAYNHFAGLQSYSNGNNFVLDESGYVVNLERNIEIIAEDDAETQNLKVPCLLAVSSLAELENSNFGGVYYGPGGPTIRFQSHLENINHQVQPLGASAN